jgi:hypothetical protein
MAHRIVDAFEVIEIDHREDQHVLLGPSEPPSMSSTKARRLGRPVRASVCAITSSSA